LQTLARERGGGERKAISISSKKEKRKHKKEEGQRPHLLRRERGEFRAIVSLFPGGDAQKEMEKKKRAVILDHRVIHMREREGKEYRSTTIARSRREEKKIDLLAQKSLPAAHLLRERERGKIQRYLREKRERTNQRRKEGGYLSSPIYARGRGRREPPLLHEGEEKGLHGKKGRKKCCHHQPTALGKEEKRVIQYYEEKGLAQSLKKEVHPLTIL